MALRDRSVVQQYNKSRAETAMGASSKGAKETAVAIEPPGTPAKEEGKCIGPSRFLLVTGT